MALKFIFIVQFQKIFLNFETIIFNLELKWIV